MIANPLLVTAIMAAYNGERYIEQALGSILRQTHRPLEVIVVDDGSTDGTADSVRRFPEVRYVFQQNRGPAAARNLALSMSSGDLVTFLDQDDEWTGDKLERQVPFMLEHPEVDCSFAWQRVTLEEEIRNDVPAPLKNYLRKNGPLQAGYLPGTLMARRSLFDRVGLFDESFLNTSDAEWFFRCKDAGAKMAVLPDILLLKRFHANNHCYQTELSQRDTLRFVRQSIGRRRHTHERDHRN